MPIVPSIRLIGKRNGGERALISTHYKVDGLSQIFQCIYDFIRNLSSCLEHSSAQRHRYMIGACTWSVVGFAWKENSIILNFLPQVFILGGGLVYTYFMTVPA